MIKGTKSNKSCQEDISPDRLVEHFSNKLGGKSQCHSEVYKGSVISVKHHYDQLQNEVSDQVFSVRMLTSKIRQLRSGCAPGLDGITSEHLKGQGQKSTVG